MKIALYTVLTGAYDSLKQPNAIDDRFDYFCFSNDIPVENIGVWKVCKIPGTFPTKQLESRYPKMHPWEVLADYEYSVYMDANICIEQAQFYDLILEKIKSGAILSGVKHPFRDCAYAEGYTVYTYSLDKIAPIVKEMRFLKKEGFPQHYGMFEANIIFRKHHDEKIKRQCQLWWSMINRYSKRDQLSYSYTLWKEGIPFNYLLPEGTSARNFPMLSMETHDRQKNIWGKKLKRVGRFLYKAAIRL